MNKLFFIILMSIMTWAISPAYAAPPGQAIAYATQDIQIATCSNCHDQSALNASIAYEQTLNTFSLTPIVMIVPAGSDKLTAPVILANQPVVVRGDHIGTIRSI